MFVGMGKRHNFPAGHGVTAAAGPRSDLERVVECLAVLSAAIEKMREAAGRTGPGSNVIGMEFSSGHDQMLTSLIVAVQPFVTPLHLDVPANSYSRGCAVLETWWGEKRGKKTAVELG